VSEIKAHFVPTGEVAAAATAAYSAAMAQAKDYASTQAVSLLLVAFWFHLTAYLPYPGACDILGVFLTDYW